MVLGGLARLHMDRRGPILRKHAMYQFVELVSPKAPLRAACGMCAGSLGSSHELQVFSGASPKISLDSN